MMIIMAKTYITYRTIRGERRLVEITNYGKGKEKIKILDQKKRGVYRPITRQEAREFHKTRSETSKERDSRKTSKVVKDERFLNRPDIYDFKGVDTKGRGMKAGMGRKAGRELRHK